MLEPVNKLLKSIVAKFDDFLEDNLVGIYLHGSLTMGCFNPDSSDIDIIAVVEKSLSPKTKKSLVKILLDLLDNNPQKLELSIVLLDTLKEFEYPTPIEFHFSEELKSKYINGTIDLIAGKKDYDLAAHITIARKHGAILKGKPIKDVFPVVPRKYYLDSIAKDSKWSYNNIIYGPNSGICGIPPYAVLNFCRVLAFIRSKLIASKKVGARWAFENLPKKYHPIIKEALNEYSKRGSSKKVSCKLLKQFARYSHQEITKANTL